MRWEQRVWSGTHADLSHALSRLTGPGPTLRVGRAPGRRPGPWAGPRHTGEGQSTWAPGLVARPSGAYEINMFLWGGCDHTSMRVAFSFSFDGVRAPPSGVTPNGSGRPCIRHVTRSLGHSPAGGCAGAHATGLYLNPPTCPSPACILVVSGVTARRVLPGPRPGRAAAQPPTRLHLVGIGAALRF